MVGKARFVNLSLKKRGNKACNGEMFQQMRRQAYRTGSVVGNGVGPHSLRMQLSPASLVCLVVLSLAAEMKHFTR